MIKNITRPLFIFTCLYFYLCLFAYTDIARGEIIITCPDNAGIGQPFLVNISSPTPLDWLADVKIAWLDVQIIPSPMDEYQAYALLASDLRSAAKGAQKLSVKIGTKDAASVSVSLTPKNYPREDLTVSDSMVNPAKELSARLNKEADMAKKALRHNLPPQGALSLPLVRPVEGAINTPYGKSRYFNGQFKGRHGGLDFKAPAGTLVKAAAAGKVVLTGDLFFAGKCVYLDHGSGIVSVYLHLSEIKVREGQMIDAGTIVGLSGQTGRVTGPHLHFGMSYMGHFFDPAVLF